MKTTLDNHSTLNPECFDRFAMQKQPFDPAFGNSCERLPGRPIRLNICLPLVVGLALLLAGCARFEHQTSQSEPHGLVMIVVDSGDMDIPVVTKLDDLPVSDGRVYRVKPGEHEVTIRFVQRGYETYQPMMIGLGDAKVEPATVTVPESGRPEAEGVKPFTTMQPVNLNIEDRRITYVTQTIKVEAGWRYELNGRDISKVKLGARP